jgi:hypothetical protein
LGDFRNKVMSNVLGVMVVLVAISLGVKSLLSVLGII